MVSFDYATIFDQFSLCVWGGGGVGGLEQWWKCPDF